MPAGRLVIGHGKDTALSRPGCPAIHALCSAGRRRSAVGALTLRVALMAIECHVRLEFPFAGCQYWDGSQLYCPMTVARLIQPWALSLIRNARVARATRRRLWVNWSAFKAKPADFRQIAPPVESEGIAVLAPAPLPPCKGLRQQFRQQKSLRLVQREAKLRPGLCQQFSQRGPLRLLRRKAKPCPLPQTSQRRRHVLTSRSKPAPPLPPAPGQTPARSRSTGNPPLVAQPRAHARAHAKGKEVSVAG